MTDSQDALTSSSFAAATISPGRSCKDEDGSLPFSMPLRVIDVEATITNRAKGGISFTRRRSWHVISHTWSADVREFSKIVGQQLQAAALVLQDDGDHRSYEQLFEDANFSKTPSYQKFVDFLIILRADEVRWVWFDAVCINQTDSQEKDKEIQQMGTYYERSLGSYVVHHGIGKGFEVLVMNNMVQSDMQVLPRWFSRAWTFQEWVLRPKTTFVIDLASEESLQKTAIAAILLSDSKQCLCCNYESTWHPQFLMECIGSVVLKSRPAVDDVRDLSTALAKIRRLCQYNKRKGGQPGHFRRIPHRTDWYFTDDLGYVFLVRLKLQMKNAVVWPGRGSIVQQQHALREPEFQLLERLGVKMSVGGMSAYGITRETKMPLVIEEISVRNCSNAEDRVLSVLKLLEVEGAIQVRSGRSLEQQIIHLARSLLEKGDREYNEMLVRLCLADGFGNERRGMSWAPHFEVKKGSWQEGGRQLAERLLKGGYLETFEARAQVQEVCKGGELRLVSEAVCAGELICCNHDLRVAKDRSRADELVKPMVMQVGGQVVFHLCARFSAQLTPDACVLEHLSGQTLVHGSSCIVIRAPRIHNPLDHLPFRKARSMVHINPLDDLRERIPVWLVKMGVGTHRAYKDYAVTYFLLCVGANLQRPLHKIGYVGISSDIVSNSQFAGLLEKRETMCLIGGLGRHSTIKHLFKKGTCFCCDCFDCFLSGYNSS